MNTVQRTRGILKAIRVRMLGKPVQRYMISGSNDCCSMMLEASQRRLPGPSDSAILAWARFDLECEILGGFWQYTAA